MTNAGGRTTGAVLMAVAAVGLAQCGREPDPNDASVAEPTPVLTPLSSLGRGDLIAALARAASAHAAGRVLQEEAVVPGRTVEIRLPFGCDGPETAGPPGLARWSASEDGSAVILSLTPADWTRSPRVLAPGAEPAWARAEGFWIARPWMTADQCPRLDLPPPPPDPVPAGGDSLAGTAPQVRLLAPLSSPMTTGLVMFEGPEASRLGRRPGEPWRFTLRGNAERPVRPPTDGYRVLLAGRIGRFPDGRPIRCMSEGSDVQPVCVAAVELDRVAFETPEGAVLSEWRPG